MKYILICVLALVSACSGQKQQSKMTESKGLPTDFTPIKKTKAEWKQSLSPEEYFVMIEKGTERAFTGDLWDNKAKGTYICAACELPLFASETKFKSGTGWPSYYQTISTKNVKEIIDNSHGMKRVEVVCGRCEGHLGHVFEDGPKPTGLRYCVNSAAMDFLPTK